MRTFREKSVLEPFDNKLFGAIQIRTERSFGKCEKTVPWFFLNNGTKI